VSESDFRDYDPEQLKVLYHDSLELIVQELQSHRHELLEIINYYKVSIWLMAETYEKMLLKLRAADAHKMGIFYDLEKAVEGDYHCEDCQGGQENCTFVSKDTCPWHRMHNIMTNAEEEYSHRRQ
jgi:hypothetical protein